MFTIKEFNNMTDDFLVNDLENIKKFAEWFARNMTVSIMNMDKKI